jgi:2-keto-3-deoxy-galactonokinase
MNQHRYDAKEVMHGEESQVPGDLRQSEILIEQYFKI